MAAKPAYEELEQEIRALRKDLEMKKEELASWKSLFDQCPFSIALLNTEGNIEDVNLKLLDVYGSKKDKVVGKHWRFFLSDNSSLKEHLSEIRRAVLEQQTVWQGEVTDIDSYGNRIWRNAKLFPIKDESGVSGKIAYVSEDISERKRAEEALKESKKKYKELTDSLPQVVFETDIEGNLTYANRNAFELFGYTQKDLDQGLNALQMLIPDDRQRALSNIQLVLKGEIMGGQEYIALRKNGSTFPVVIHSNLVVRDGKSVGLRGIVVDLSKLKQTEEKLRESEERLRFTTDQIPGTLWTTDKQLRFTLSVGAGLPALGLEPGQVVGMSLYEFFGTDDPDYHSIKIHRQVLEGHSVKYEDHWKGRYYETYLEPFRDSMGSVNGVIGISFDITDRKQAEKDLKESEERLSGFMNSASDSFNLLDSKLNFIDINTKGLEIIGKDKDEVIGKNIVEIVPDIKESGRYEKHLEVIRTGKSFEIEDFIPHPIFGDLNFILKSFKVGQGLGVIATDITDLKKAEDERRKLEAKLIQAQKMESIGTLAGGIAHDFNNILSPIMVHSEMAMMELPSDSPVQQSLQQIFKAGERARDLVKQILTFARRREEDRITLKMSLIVKDAIKFLRSTIPTTIDIRYELKTDKDIVLADPTQMNQIVMNLCTNAAHAMREKGGVLKIKLIDEYIESDKITQFVSLNSGHYLRLSVSDTGSGIPPDIIDKIFEPYFTTKGPGEGTGMGLAVIHGILNSYDGGIIVESEVGKETTFHVLLPIIEAEVSPTIEPKIQFPGGNERILFVDDEKAAVDSIQPMLERLGYKVTSRTSSIEALEAFRNKHAEFDLTITDQTMPNMTGKELAKELMSIRPDIPIILCTGFSEQIDERAAEKMGIRAFVMKPILIKEMANTIREVLDKG